MLDGKGGFKPIDLPKKKKDEDEEDEEVDEDAPTVQMKWDPRDLGLDDDDKPSEEPKAQTMGSADQQDTEPASPPLDSPVAASPPVAEAPPPPAPPAPEPEPAPAPLPLETSKEEKKKAAPEPKKEAVPAKATEAEPKGCLGRLFGF